jgi:D-alanyl-lipoteichoic acid acyltransferase DltB (MBOAT superfamily)
MESEKERATTRPTRRALHRQYLPDRTARPEAEPFLSRIESAFPALHDGEPETCRRDLRLFALSLVQLALLFAVFRVYRIEDRPFQGRAFQTITLIAILALPVHYLAPFRWKKPVFVAASLLGLFAICGSVIGAWVVGIASMLIGVTFLPIPWAATAGVCAVIALSLAAARPYLDSSGIPEAVWPVVASMFMFRLIIYLYERKHARQSEKLIDTISYFFLLPNFCFPLFPVIDYQTMLRGYFADDVHKMQRRGLAMMFRGTIHLICYRVIYHELLIPAASVNGAWSLAQYVVCNYLLYIQVSGQFHMACGMLYLFGFQLPETHHRYLLATGFTDYWRRINIYWKDFMIRLVFNPVAFKLKRWPQPAMLAVATSAVFLATWLLHGYQSYWLRGTWGFSVPDALFWGILGMLVLVNVQLDARRRPGSSRKPATAAMHLFRGLKVAGTFSTIAILWSLWSSPSLADWLDLIQRGLQ